VLDGIQADSTARGGHRVPRRLAYPAVAAEFVAEPARNRSLADRGRYGKLKESCFDTARSKASNHPSWALLSREPTVGFRS